MPSSRMLTTIPLPEKHNANVPLRFNHAVQSHYYNQFQVTGHQTYFEIGYCNYSTIILTFLKKQGIPGLDLDLDCQSLVSDGFGLD